VIRSGIESISDEFDESRVDEFDRYDVVLEKLKHRGPDFQHYFKHKNCI
jgi:hypothetical protein